MRTWFLCIYMRFDWEVIFGIQTCPTCQYFEALRKIREAQLHARFNLPRYIW